MDNYRNIGKRIKQERKALKLTQKDLAKRANIDFRFLGNIERGVSKPSLNTFVKIAQALDIPTDILCAKEVIRQNPPELPLATKEVVRIMSMLNEEDATKVLQLIRYAIELFTGKEIIIPNEVKSYLEDERKVYKKSENKNTINLLKRKKSKQQIFLT